MPADLYVLTEQHAAGFGPDVLTLQDTLDDSERSGVAIATRTRPNTTHSQTATSF